MTLPETVVALLLEDFQRDFVAVFGPKMPPDGYYAHADRFMASMQTYYPNFQTIEQAVNGLVDGGHVVIIANKGNVHVFSQNTNFNIPKSGAHALEHDYGLGQMQKIAYSSQYGQRPTELPVENLLKTKPKPEEVKKPEKPTDFERKYPYWAAATKSKGAEPVRRVGDLATGLPDPKQFR